MNIRFRRFIFSTSFILTLITGIIIGLLLAYSLHVYYFGDNHLSSVGVYPSWTEINYSREIDESTVYIDQSTAEKLRNEVRILCWVMTTPENHGKRAQHIKNTWGKRCNKLLFMSTVEDDQLPSIALPVSEGRNYLWPKVKEAYKYIYKNHENEYDWVLKADDDTYVIVENLRYLLLPYNASKPMYLGSRLRRFVAQGYMQGGSGYILSKEAVRQFVVDALEKLKCQEFTYGPEDVEVGNCMEMIGIPPTDTRDSYGRHRFLPEQLETHIFYKHIDPNFWFDKYSVFPVTDGLNCCSDFAATFHYVTPFQMYIYDYMIYNLRPYGVSYIHKNLSTT